VTVGRLWYVHIFSKVRYILTSYSKYRALTLKNFYRLFGAFVLAASARSPCLHGRRGRERMGRVALGAVVGAERTGGGEWRRGGCVRRARTRWGAPSCSALSSSLPPSAKSRVLLVSRLRLLQEAGAGAGGRRSDGRARGRQVSGPKM